MTVMVDAYEYKARQRAKLRTKRAKVITALRTDPWTDAEDAIAADRELFLVEKMAILQRSELDIKNRMSAIAYGVEVVCGNCGASFMSPVKRGSSRMYCSIFCRGQASRSLVSIECAHCRKIFMPQNADMRYCSRECVGKSRQLPPIACANCQQIFIPRQSRIRYCSKDCRFAARRTLTPIACNYCKKVFRPHTASVKFCSKTCTGHAKTAKHVSEHSKPCPVCGIVFVALARGRGKRAIHCSRDCQVKAATVPRVECVICQAEFPRHASRKTCSRECGLAYRIARKAENREQWRRPCPQCGKSFIANAISSRNGVLNRRTFCSKDCAVKAHWVRRRASLLEQPGTGVQVQPTKQGTELQ